MVGSLRSRKVIFLVFFLAQLAQILFLNGAYAISDDDAKTMAFPSANLTSIAEADAFARKIIAQYETESKKTGVATKDMDPIVVFHVGRLLPRPLEWVLVQLESAHIPVLPTQQITEEELEVAADKAKDKALKAIEIEYRHQNPAETTTQKRSIIQAWQESKLKFREVFGLANGLSGGVTAWLRVQRSTNLKQLEAKLASVTSLIKGGSVAFTFYLTNKAGTPVHEFRAGFFLGLCTWWFVYEARRFTEVMSLAKKVKPLREGVYAASESVLFRLVTATVRSFITNMVVMAAAFGTEHTFTLHSTGENLINTGLGLFAYYLVFDPIDARMPTLLDDGRAQIDYSKGQWPLSKWLMINSAATILLGFGKNIQLLNLGTWGNSLYIALGALGAVKMIYGERLNLKHEIISFIHTLRSSATVSPCETLLVLPPLSGA